MASDDQFWLLDIPCCSFVFANRTMLDVNTSQNAETERPSHWLRSSHQLHLNWWQPQEYVADYKIVNMTNFPFQQNMAYLFTSWTWYNFSLKTYIICIDIYTFYAYSIISIPISINPMPAMMFILLPGAIIRDNEVAGLTNWHLGMEL